MPCLIDVVKTVIKLFVDDAKLLGKVKNESDRNSLQNDLNKLTEWSHTWKLNFTASKCKVHKNKNYKYTISVLAK